MQNYFENIGQNLSAAGFRLGQSSLLTNKASFFCREIDSYKILGKYIFVINIFKDEVFLYEALVEALNTWHRRIYIHIHICTYTLTCHPRLSQTC